MLASDFSAPTRWLSHPGMLSLWCVAAAFGTYACMYGFRKPFTAGTYLDAESGASFKTWLVTAQVLGYTFSKFPLHPASLRGNPPRLGALVSCSR